MVGSGVSRRSMRSRRGGGIWILNLIKIISRGREDTAGGGIRWRDRVEGRRILIGKGMWVDEGEWFFKVEWGGE
jgi:hypothetical protein